MRTFTVGLLVTALLGLPTAATGQATWVNVTPIVHPPSAGQAYMTYDTLHRRVLLFKNGETWEWDGASWYRRTPASPPIARAGAGLAFDRARGRAVLFGGVDGARLLDDTWEWDGTQWSAGAPPTTPGPRQYFAMNWDENTGRVLVFGGAGPNGLLGDTWAWDGSTWTALNPPTTPGALFVPQLVSDPLGSRTLLFGCDSSLVPVGFGWDGQTWLRLSASGLTFATFPTAVAHDPFRRMIVGFRASTASAMAAKEWDGTAWTDIPLRTILPGADSFSAVADEARGQVILTGTIAGTPSTWVLATDCRRVAPGHPLDSLPLACQTSPLLGQHLCVSYPSTQNFGLLLVGPGPCDTPIATVDLPLFCAQGSVYAQPWVLLTSTMDPALTCLQIPFDLAYLGLRACLQGIALQPGNCLRLTDVNETRVRLR